MAAADVEDMASARQHGGRDGEDEVVVFVADGGADGFVAEDDAAAPGRERIYAADAASTRIEADLCGNQE